MNRKEFIKWNAAVLAGMALPFKAGAAAKGNVLGANPVAGNALEAMGAAAASGDDEALWEIVRSQFVLDPKFTYLNFGGLGACPLPVLHSLDEWNRAEELSPDARHDFTEWNKVKAKLAALLGKSCRAEDLAFLGCATEGCNAIINGLSLKKGDEVITTTHEHIAINASLLGRAKKDGVVIRFFDPDPENGLGNVDRIARLINKKTKLIFISHVLCTTGQTLPVKEIARLAREKGVLYALDGAQAHVNVPFDIVESGADFYTSSTHKWLMGPKRTGFLYVRQGMLDVLWPYYVGMTSSEKIDLEKQEIAFRTTAQRYEYGTQNDALYFALGTACDFVNAIGLERIQSRAKGMSERFYEGLKEIPGVEILSPTEEAYRSCMIAFRMKTHDFDSVYDHLMKDKIITRKITEANLNAIRVSFYLNNRPEDVDAILNSLKRLAQA